MFAFESGIICFCCSLLIFGGRNVALSKVTVASAVGTGNGNIAISQDFNAKNQIARGLLDDRSSSDGIYYLYIDTEPGDDELAAYAAGAIEAFLTKDLTGWNLRNNYETKKSDDEYMKDVNFYLSRQRKYLYKHAFDGRFSSPFWNQVYLCLMQIAGFTDEYSGKLSQPGNFDKDPYFISKHYMVLFLSNAEIRDLELTVLGAFDTPPRDPFTYNNFGTGLGLIKVLKNYLLVGHSKYDSYKNLLRIHKRYHFAFRETADASSRLVRGRMLSFSSYPGTLYSADDFLLSSSGILQVATYVPNFNRNITDARYGETVPTSLRSMVAGRLARDPEETLRIFITENSGLGSNLRMAISYKNFGSSEICLNDSFVWLCETSLFKSSIIDISKDVLKSTFFLITHIPYTIESYQGLGYQDLWKRYGDFFSYERNPARQLVSRLHHNIKDVDSMLELLRYNKFFEDEESNCSHCKPPRRLPILTVAPRYDLLDDIGLEDKYYKRDLYGAIDAKATDQFLFKKGLFLNINGPTYLDKGAPNSSLLRPFQFIESHAYFKFLSQRFDYVPHIHKWEAVCKYMK